MVVSLNIFILKFENFINKINVYVGVGLLVFMFDKKG